MFDLPELRLFGLWFRVIFGKTPFKRRCFSLRLRSGQACFSPTLIVSLTAGNLTALSADRQAAGRPETSGSR